MTAANRKRIGSHCAGRRPGARPRVRDRRHPALHQDGADQQHGVADRGRALRRRALLRSRTRRNSRSSSRSGNSSRARCMRAPSVRTRSTTPLGPRCGSSRRRGKDNQNLPPSAGMQFFGHVKIDGASGQMTVTLRDRADVALWSTTLDPKFEPEAGRTPTGDQEPPERSAASSASLEHGFCSRGRVVNSASDPILGAVARHEDEGNLQQPPAGRRRQSFSRGRARRRAARNPARARRSPPAPAPPTATVRTRPHAKSEQASPRNRSQ